MSENALVPPPNVDDVRFGDLYQKDEYTSDTADGWRLVITRYKPIRQEFAQPLFGQPILLVHGFTQNRHCWSAGEFVKNLLYFGVDVHILELRGHGKSSVRLQQELYQRENRGLPADIDYGWDIDSYYLFDIPAAVAAVREKSGKDKIFYCGHSMGGMLAYGYAGVKDDLLGLVTIGSPSELGKGFWPIRLAGFLDLLLPVTLRQVRNVGRARKLAYVLRSKLQDLKGQSSDEPAPDDWDIKYLPFDELFRLWGKVFKPLQEEGLSRISKLYPVLYNPARVVPENILWLLTWGAEREPVGVVRQFARWVRNNELKCYRSGHDFKKNFDRIDIPIAIIFGDEDRLANLKSTRGVYRNVSSEYLLWRPVRGNSHMELTMGHDIRQICYDIKNLMEYAISHRVKQPSLPKRGEEKRNVRTDVMTRRARLLKLVK